ncbi:hypothetical protein [Cetobacterium sp.]|uniref:hypothetical protein n=1 Tax=Cetobacterium sp. TaxID=2071632 RepID=UPI003F37ECD1
MISLKKHKQLFIENNFFVIHKGRVNIKIILENGNAIGGDICFQDSDIIGNFFLLSSIPNISFPYISLEVKALEDTILEEFYVHQIKILNNFYLDSMLKYLIKHYYLKLLSHIYNKKMYILILLSFYATSKGIILKKHIHYENFNISKSQFYLIYSKLKKENYLEEKNNKILLNLAKINISLNLKEF